MVDGSHQMTAGAKEILHESVHREKSLRLCRGLEPPHLPLALSRRLMRDLDSIVLVLRIAPQFVRDQAVGQPALSLQHLAEESYGRPAIAARLDEDVEEVAVLVHGSPEISALPLNRGEDLVQIPGVGRRNFRA